jgi:hypothetical protein
VRSLELERFLVPLYFPRRGSTNRSVTKVADDVTITMETNMK